MKPILNKYLIDKNNKNEREIKENFNNDHNSIFSKIKIDLNDLITDYNNKFCSEFLSLNNKLENKNTESSKDIKKTQKNKKELYFFSLDK